MATGARSAARLSSSATSVDRGETITLSGWGWGSGCNDVNPDPSEGALFAPRTRIVIKIVQDGHHTVLAKGNASSDYSFTVRVTVPSTLQPGPATVDIGGVDVPVNLTISDAPPVEGAEASVVRFGPTHPAKARPLRPGYVAPTSEGRSTSDLWWVAWTLIVVAAGVLVFARKFAAARRQ